MKSKKLLAIVGAVAVTLPGLAFAYTPQAESTVVEGHTVFTTVASSAPVSLAAIAGKAAKITTFGGIAWFGSQELYGGSQREDLAAGAYVLAGETGDDSPQQHFGDLRYAESYRITDPNNRAWVVDRYVYEVCTVNANDTSAEVPCTDGPPGEVCAPDGNCTDVPDWLEEPPGDEPGDTRPDLDGDGNPDSLPVPDENCVPECPGEVVVVKSVYVVEISGTTADTCTSQGDYNFLLLVRMDALKNVVDDGATVGTGTYDTAQVDLYLHDERPAEPAARDFLVDDQVGGCAP